MIFDPRLVEAKIALQQIGFQEFPALAGDALEAGFDGPAIRRMAALVQPTGFETDELLHRFMLEAELAAISPFAACVRLAIQLATEILDRNLDALPYLGKFERWFMLADYPAEFQELGLLEEDAYVMKYSGSSEDEIRAWVLERLQAFLRANEAAKELAPDPANLANEGNNQ